MDSVTGPVSGAVCSQRWEELRILCGTRSGPATVAPFRAWRGSRGIVAQCPAFVPRGLGYPNTIRGRVRYARGGRLAEGAAARILPVLGLGPVFAAVPGDHARQ